jgi:hypothetical protein
MFAEYNVSVAIQNSPVYDIISYESRYIEECCYIDR